jgi:hypothetical protein
MAFFPISNKHNDRVNNNIDESQVTIHTLDGSR